MKIDDKLQKINAIISAESWFDMEVLEMKKGNLLIIGSTDFTYGHSLEVIFEDVFHMCINSEWKTNTNRAVFYLVDNEERIMINKSFQIEQGNILFKIISEDLEEPFYVSAKNINFNTDRVLYYKKDNLEENERIADWVK
jgi:hypothetical protein